MSLTLAQEMLNVKLNCDGFMTDSESEEEDRVRPECAPGQLGLLTALTRFHGDLAQVMNCRVRPDNAPGQL